MDTRLTLRLDKDLIDGAKRYAAGSGKSVSRLVADFFMLIEAGGSPTRVTPRVQSLRGVLSNSRPDEGDYHKHLEDPRHR